MQHVSICFSLEQFTDLLSECTVTSCSLETQTCNPDSLSFETETKFFHNGGLFYCPPDGEYDYILWKFDCVGEFSTLSLEPQVFLLPTAAEHRTIGVVELNEEERPGPISGFRSTSREDISIVIKLGSTTLEELPPYNNVDEQLKSFLECNGEQLQVQARDGDGNVLDLTIEGPLPRFDDSIVDSCWENNSTCDDGFACATCNEDKSVDLVRVVGYEKSSNLLIEGLVARTKRGSSCPIEPSIAYDDDFAYVYTDFRLNGLQSIFLPDELLPRITSSRSHGPGLFENSEKIFSCRSSSTMVSPTQTSKPDASAGAENAPSQDPTTAPSTTPEEGNSSESAQDSSEQEEVCLEVEWLRFAGVNEDQMLHKESIASRVLCPHSGIPCGTPDHLLLKDGKLISYADLCRFQECESRRAMVNSASHLHLMRAPIHFEDVSVTGCSGKLGSWQRWIEEVLVRRLYIAHRARNMV
ncbi:hypothetical protein FGB62_297g04 [Gracilaria domingensis]|nr:hypothetical protein FGB62_297g04 [Gracilaria domingensis]